MADFTPKQYNNCKGPTSVQRRALNRDFFSRFGTKPDAFELGLGFDDRGQAQSAITAWLERLEATLGYDA